MDFTVLTDTFCAFSSLKGYLDMKYDDLVSLFGQPEVTDDGKTQVRWTIKTGDTIITIYDWKIDEPPTTITEWNVGGYSKAAVDELHKILRTKYKDLVDFELRHYSQDAPSVFRGKLVVSSMTSNLLVYGS
jgi:hypothetical protein